jgi:hypothetical protein
VVEQRPVSTLLKLYGRSTKLININWVEHSTSIQWSWLNSCWQTPEDCNAVRNLCPKDHEDNYVIERDSCFLLGGAGAAFGQK